MKGRHLLKGLLAIGLLSVVSTMALASNPEVSGKITRVDIATKRIYIEPRWYDLRGEAYDVLMAYRAEHGIGSLIGLEVDYLYYQRRGADFYINRVVITEQEQR